MLHEQQGNAGSYVTCCRMIHACKVSWPLYLINFVSTVPVVQVIMLCSGFGWYRSLPRSISHAGVCPSPRQGLDESLVDWPFRVSEAEQRIIELQSPSSIILLGRSGTGKTTCAVFRMWSRWYTSNASSSAEPFHQARCDCACLCKFLLDLQRHPPQ